MSGRGEILFAAHRIPYPPDKGDKIRTWRLFKHLTERFDVHLACFVDDPRDMKHREFLAGMCKSSHFARLDPGLARLKSARGLLTGAPLTFPFYHDNRLAEYIDDVRARPLAAEVVFSSSMAPYIKEPASPRLPVRPRLVDLCDSDAEKWRQYAEKKSGLMKFIYAREARKLAEAETDIVNWAEASFAITADEADLLAARPGIEKQVQWWSNGVDADYFSPVHEMPMPAKRADIVFVGAMDYWANIDAARWFEREVWPRLRARYLEARFAIVGARPSKEIKALDGKKGVIVTGQVDDVRPWLKEALVVVAPLRIGRGVQNKVLEAMAMGKAVVATPEAAQGISAIEETELVVAGNPVTFADEVDRLLTEPGLAHVVGARARKRILTDYDWHAQLKRFDAVLSDLGVHSGV